MGFDVDKMRKEVDKIQKENEKQKQGGRGLSTLLQFVKGKKVKVTLTDGEIIEGKLEKYSLYEIQVNNKVIWKQNIKYLEINE